MIVKSIMQHHLNSTYFMKLALEEAKKALINNEIPVGCVIVDKNTSLILSKSHNKTEECKNFLMHAEIVAINQTCKVLNKKYLNECDIYVTLKPCYMCLYALKLCRIGNIYYGASSNDELGYTGNCLKTLGIDCSRLYGNIMKEESKELLDKFFSNKRY